jgi:hypothetical protein
MKIVTNLSVIGRKPLLDGKNALWQSIVITSGVSCLGSKDLTNSIQAFTLALEMVLQGKYLVLSVAGNSREFSFG